MNTKFTEIKNKIHNHTGFINISEFNKHTKIYFETKMKKASKRLVSKVQVDNALDIADKT